MERSQRSDRVESRNPSPFLVDLHLESHAVWQDDDFVGSETTKSIYFLPVEQVSAEVLDPQLPEKEVVAAISLDKKIETDSNKNVFLGMAVMAIMAIGLWSWIMMKDEQAIPLHSQIVLEKIAGQTLMDMTPVLLPSVRTRVTNDFAVHMQQSISYAHRYLDQGKQALKERHIQLAIKNFELARKKLSGIPHEKTSELWRDLNRLHANALYWQGFLALQQEKECQAKTYFVEAKKLAPADQKIEDRLLEISSSLRC